MYCPVCFNSSLMLRKQGIVQVLIDGRPRNASKFLFNTDKETKEEMIENLKDKVDEYYKWYCGFQNKTNEVKIGLFSGDYICMENYCVIPSNTTLNVVGTLFDKDETLALVQKIGTKYKLSVTLDLA